MKNKKYRRAIFAVTYSKNSKGKIEYLILKRKLHWKGWEFPKGKIEKFELKRRTAKREVFEETGLKPVKIKRLGMSGKYDYEKKLKDRPGIVGQTFDLFMVEVKKGKIFMDKKEHSGYEWVDFKGAIKKITWPNQKLCMKIVNEILEKNKR